MIEVVKPFPTVALPRVWRWIEAVREQIADDYFASTIDAFVDDWLLNDQSGQRMTWAVKCDGAIGGVITSARLSPVIRDFHIIMQRGFWGRNITLPAIEAVLEEIFTPTEEGGYGALKLSTLMFASNLSTATLLRIFGVKREGLLHGHTLRGGKPVDLVMLGLQRETFNVFRDQRRDKQQQQQHESSRAAGTRPVHKDQPAGDDGNQHIGTDQRTDDGRNGHIENPDAGTVADRADAVQADPAAIDKPLVLDSPRAEPSAQPGG